MAHDILAVDFGDPDPSAIRTAARALESDGVALFPCDTVYTVGTLPDEVEHVPAGVERLFSFKRRGGGPSFPWLVASPDMLDTFGADVSDEARRLVEAFWPGGLSVVVRASRLVPRALAHPDGTISLRMSASPVVAALLAELGRPMVSTGANVHGTLSPLAFGDVAPEIVEAVDVALDAGEHVCRGRATIIDCSRGPARIMRAGVVSPEEIDDALGYRMPVV